MKKPLIRISAAAIWPRGYHGWPDVVFEVERRLTGETPIPVTSPAEARAVAERLAADPHGGRIYRGRLPDAWHCALADYPRS